MIKTHRQIEEKKKARTKETYFKHEVQLTTTLNWEAQQLMNVRENKFFEVQKYLEQKNTWISSSLL